MISRTAAVIAAVAVISPVPAAGAAEAPAVPDFSGGIPGAPLEKKEENKGMETFHLKTDLGEKEFSERFHNSLGAGWSKRILSKEEMILAASRGRAKNAEVNLSVFEHAKLPGVDIRVMYFKHKKENTGASVEIVVLRPM